MNDQEVISHLKKGNRLALRHLYEKEGDALLNFAFQTCGNRYLAEDLTHDLFVELNSLVHNFKFQCSFRTWLFAVLKRKTLDQIRKKKRRQNLLEFFPFKSSHEQEEEYSAHQLLKNLDEDTRALLWLKEVEGFTTRELAESLNIPENTLKSRIKRAKQTLQDQELHYATL